MNAGRKPQQYRKCCHFDGDRDIFIAFITGISKHHLGSYYSEWISPIGLMIWYIN